MKGKIKLVVEDSSYYTVLTLKLKLEDELFYSHEFSVIGSKSIYSDPLPQEKFYQEIIDYISDINNIKRDGEYLMKEVLADRVKNLQKQSNKKKANLLLKKLKSPIEIEIKL